MPAQKLRGGDLRLRNGLRANELRRACCGDRSSGFPLSSPIEVALGFSNCLTANHLVAAELLGAFAGVFSNNSVSLRNGGWHCWLVQQCWARATRHAGRTPGATRPHSARTDHPVAGERPSADSLPPRQIPGSRGENPARHRLLRGMAITPGRPSAIGNSYPRLVGPEKGGRHLLPERPYGCFAQKVPVTFFPAPERYAP